MDKDYSVNDILSELNRGDIYLNSDAEDYNDILDELLGKKNPKEEKFEPINKDTLDKIVKKDEKKEDNGDFANTKIVFEDNVPEQEDEIIEEKAPSNPPEEIKREPEKPISTPAFEQKRIIKEKTTVENFKVRIDYNSDVEKISDEEMSLKVPDFSAEEKTIKIDKISPLKYTDDDGGLLSSQSAEPEENDDEFKQNRKEKVDKFVLFGNEEEDSDSPDEIEEPVENPQTVIDDFEDYSDASSIKKDLSALKASLTLRFIILSIISLFTAYIEFGSFLHIPVPDVLSKATQPLVYLVVLTLLFVASVVISAPAVFSGMVSLFSAKADSDSLLAVSVIGAIVQFAVIYLNISEFESMSSTITIYSLISILNMLVNTFGKLSIVERVKLNFRFVSGKYEKCSVSLAKNEKLSSFVKDNFDTTYSGLAVMRKTKFIGDFLNNSYKEDPADKLSKVLSLVLLVGSLLASVACFFLSGKNIITAAGSFAAITAICSPISIVLASNLPVYNTVKKIRSGGCMIASADSCNSIYDVNTVLVDSSMLFPKGSVSLSAIKTFAAGKIDDAIIDAASVVIASESDLSDVFMMVIGSKKELLRPVEGIAYEQSLGLTAWVDSRRILIGNRELINNHGIQPPSKDYEDRYLSDGVDIVYLAVSGELTAAFLIKYDPGTKIKKAFKSLSSLGIGIAVSSVDPNITVEKMSEIFEVDSDMIKVVPAQIQKDVAYTVKSTLRENSGIACADSFTSFVQTVYASIKLKSATSLGAILAAICAILGFAFSAFFAVMSGNVNVSVGAVLLYQLFWLLSVCVIPSLRKIRIN